jgi:hypothetical protein
LQQYKICLYNAALKCKKKYYGTALNQFFTHFIFEPSEISEEVVFLAFTVYHRGAVCHDPVSLIYLKGNAHYSLIEVVLPLSQALKRRHKIT